MPGVSQLIVSLMKRTLPSIIPAFTPPLWEGIHTYTYVARATTPGEYVAPPARAEEMYAPETFGRTGTDRVIVE